MIKLKMLILYRFNLKQWYNDVWKIDEAARMCCDCYMCGCMGSDYYSYWEHLWETRK
jgi:hypothetical protein